ncbi:unnamed protein product [Ranitomeya imitator]|uniref:Uncharacterized protein n=1 Tax=Ranitomeya imitator TaxID=111125 RepID=A0ABN9KQ33_9NEOB|nr:unnamed protein product [Ranitomeya imitator]
MHPLPPLCGTTNASVRISARRNATGRIRRYCESSASDTYQLSLLQKSLSFCPAYKFNSFELSMDFQRFFRNLRLRVHFSKQPPVVEPTDRGTSSLL